jgi:hypothetical protein
MTERQIQIQIVKWLRSERHLAIHVPNEGHRSPREAAILKRMGVITGVPDLLVLDLGLAIEVKTPKGTLTRSQDLFLQALRAIGWTVGVARSLEDAQEIVRSCRTATKTD